jgi:hypothetical protein
MRQYGRRSANHAAFMSRRVTGNCMEVARIYTATSSRQRVQAQQAALPMRDRHVDSLLVTEESPPPITRLAS